MKSAFVVPSGSFLRLWHRPVLIAWCILGFFMVNATKAAVIHTFDGVFIGDDPGGSFNFGLSPVPGTPVVFTFLGYVENQNLTVLGHSGVRFSLYWNDLFGTRVSTASFPSDGVSAVDLPVVDPILGPQRVPVEFSLTTTAIPSDVTFTVEGVGPADNFRMVGTLTMESIPEPRGGLLIGLVSAGGSMRRRRSQGKGKKRCGMAA
jgi:hypothetical protein